MNENLVQSISHALFYNTVFRYAGLIFQLVYSVVVVRALGLELYAGFVVIGAFVNSMVFFNALGYGETFVRYFPEIKASHGVRGLIKGVAFLLTLRTAGTIGLILIVKLLMSQVAQYLSIGPIVQSHIDLALLLFSIITFSSAFEVILRAFLLQKAIGIVRVTRTILFPILVLSTYFYLKGLALNEVLIAFIVSETVALILTITFVARFIVKEHREESKIIHVETGLKRRALTFSGVSIVLRFLDYLAGYSFLVMALSIVLEAPEIAVFGLGYHFVSRAFVVVNAPSERLGTPILANVRSFRGAQTMSKAYRIMMKFNLMTVLPLGVLMIPMIRPAMVFLYPEDFSGAVIIAQLFTIQMIIISIFSISRSILLVSEKYFPIILSSSLYLGLVPLIIYIGGRYSLLETVIVIVLMRICVISLQTFFARKKFEIEYPVDFAKRVLYAIMGIIPLLVITLVFDNLIYAGLLTASMLGIFILLFKRLGGLDTEAGDLLMGSGIPGRKILYSILN